MLIDWSTITVAEARRRLGAARRAEQKAAEAWERDDTPELKAAWDAALELEENLQVFVHCGLRPGE